MVDESPSSQETISEPSESTRQEEVLSKQAVDDWLHQDSLTKPWMMSEVDDMFRLDHTTDLQQTVSLICDIMTK